jgi:hypothetical protein
VIGATGPGVSGVLRASATLASASLASLLVPAPSPTAYARAIGERGGTRKNGAKKMESWATP